MADITDVAAQVFELGEHLQALNHNLGSDDALRMRIAAMALQGYLAGRDGAGVSPSAAAIKAVRYADALIEALDAPRG